MSHVSKDGFCVTCRPLLKRDTLVHRRSVAHKRSRRLRALLSIDCLTYAEIGSRLGISRERVRQLADQSGPKPHVGWERRKSCTLNKKRMAFRKRRFVQELLKRRFQVEPVYHRKGVTWFSKTMFYVNGLLVSLQKASFMRKGKYVSLYKPARRADVYVWALPDNNYLILPKEKLTFPSMTSFAMHKVSPRTRGASATRHHHYFSYVNAWRVFLTYSRRTAAR